MTAHRRPDWHEVLGRSGIPQGPQAPIKRLVASYREDQLRQVLEFIHAEVARNSDVQVYNIHYENAVAGASADEPVEQVLARLEPGIRRFVFPVFRGQSRGIRVEHADLTMIAEGPDFASIEEVRDRWVALLGPDARLGYGLDAGGRLARRSDASRFVHLLVQVVALYDDAEPRVVSVETIDGPGRHPEAAGRVTVAGDALACSDCGGYHPPVVADELWRLVGSQSFGTWAAEFGRGGDVLHASLELPALRHHMDFVSDQLDRIRAVESLYARAFPRERPGGGRP